MSANMMYRLAAHSYFKQSAVEKNSRGVPCSTLKCCVVTAVREQRNAASVPVTLWIFRYMDFSANQPCQAASWRSTGKTDS